MRKIRINPPDGLLKCHCHDFLQPAVFCPSQYGDRGGCVGFISAVVKVDTDTFDKDPPDEVNVY